MTLNEQRDILDDWHDLMNMKPAELEAWLETEESRSACAMVGQNGQLTALKVLELARLKPTDLTAAEWAKMREITFDIERSLAAGRPSDAAAQTVWRYALMNCGHDPLRY